MEYLSVKDIADKWNITIRQVQKLCADGRIVNAKRVSRIWLIPQDAEKPADLRRKNNVIVTINGGFHDAKSIR
ncbi:MAG TPA: DNA-binding protein [Anaerovoracaceae bacterium]|nr:DNA-binding protein [Anaerovoracaceae bacterium]